MTETPPGDGCAGGRPPAPGIQAERSGDGGEVTVRYRFGQVPPGCRPARLLVTIDVNDDGAPGFTEEFRLQGRRGQVRLGVPEFFRTDPDVAKASAFTSRGARSDVAVVLIS